MAGLSFASQLGGKYYRLPAQQSLSASSAGYWWLRLRALRWLGGHVWNTAGYGRLRYDIKTCSTQHSVGWGSSVAVKFRQKGFAAVNLASRLWHPPNNLLEVLIRSLGLDDQWCPTCRIEAQGLWAVHSAAISVN